MTGRACWRRAGVGDLECVAALLREGWNANQIARKPEMSKSKA